jgi:signal transduction histidine kinase
VLRHAQATNVIVFITASQGRLRIEVTDDGVGLDGRARNAVGSGASVHDSLPDTGGRGGRGLANMQRRASALGGTARIESPAPGRGTHIVVDVLVMRPHGHAVGHSESRR